MVYKIKLKKKVKSISPDTYAVEWAVDGKTYRHLKDGTIEKMYDFFTQDTEIRKHLILNPFGKFRLKNLKTGKVIGVLSYNPKTKQFVHTKR